MAKIDHDLVKAVNKLVKQGYFKAMPDQPFLNLMYRMKFGEWMDWENPQTFNQKLQWLKVNDRRPEYSQMVDKYEARKFVAEVIGDEYLIPMIGIWDTVEEIDWEALPDKFVMKATHDSGSYVICRDKSQLDIKAAKDKLKHALSRSYYDIWREWPYKDVKPRIIAEELMVDESGTDLKDYKFMCFSGQANFMFIISDRAGDPRCDFFDMDFNHLPFRRGYPTHLQPFTDKPKNFELMQVIAEKLSAGIPHVRVDLYDINGNIYFGEMTFFSGAGWEHFEPEEWDQIVGDMITLPSQEVKEDKGD